MFRKASVQKMTTRQPYSSKPPNAHPVSVSQTLALGRQPSVDRLEGCKPTHLPNGKHTPGHSRHAPFLNSPLRGGRKDASPAKPPLKKGAQDFVPTCTTPQSANKLFGYRCGTANLTRSTHDRAHRGSNAHQSTKINRADLMTEVSAVAASPSLSSRKESAKQNPGSTHALLQRL